MMRKIVFAVNDQRWMHVIALNATNGEASLYKLSSNSKLISIGVDIDWELCVRMFMWASIITTKDIEFWNAPHHDDGI